MSELSLRDKLEADGTLPALVASREEKSEEPPPLPGVLTDTSWTPPVHLSYAAWEKIGRHFRGQRHRVELAETNVLWWLADWLNYGEAAFPDRYAQALSGTDYSRGALNNIARIGRAFTPGRRRPPEKATIWIHDEVSRLSPGEADALLDRWVAPDDAEDKIASRGELRQIVRELRRVEERDSALFEVDATNTQELDTCPFCEGKGTMPKERAAALRREAANL